MSTPKELSTKKGKDGYEDKWPVPRAYLIK